MIKYDELTGSYSVRISKTGNVVLKSQYAKMTLKPKVLRALVGWLHKNCSTEEWLPSDLDICSEELANDK